MAEARVEVVAGDRVSAPLLLARISDEGGTAVGRYGGKERGEASFDCRIYRHHGIYRLFIYRLVIDRRSIYRLFIYRRCTYRVPPVRLSAQIGSD